MRSIQLSPPDLRNHCRGDHVGCVRPMRRGGPRIDAAMQDDKLVTHAYGFGGAGWTLAPGVAQHALHRFDELRTSASMPEGADVAVVGAGVIGLSVANQLAARPNVGTVTVYAERMDGLASHNAGGLLAPVYLGVAMGTLPWLADVAVEAYRAWAALARRECNVSKEQCAARYMSSYQNSGWSELNVYIDAGLMPPAEPVAVRFGDTGAPRVMDRFETLFLNAGTMMRRMHRETQQRGVLFSQERVPSFSALDEPIVFNCAGLGGGALAGDDSMVPLLGHLIRLKNQTAFDAQQYMTSTRLEGGSTYYIPKIDAQTQGVLGGSSYEGVGDPHAFPETFDAIWERGKTYFYGPARGRDWYTGPN